MTILVAAGAAVLVLLSGSLPWGPLLTRNLSTGISMPWAVAPMALYLGVYWMVVSGRWPGGSANRAQRRMNLRANSLAWSLWCASIAGGCSGSA